MPETDRNKLRHTLRVLGREAWCALMLTAALVAGADGVAPPCEGKIEITDNQTNSSDMEVKNPHLVCYDWQTLAAADSLIEPGYECGVSAPFFGTLDGKLIIAGGCNFPFDDPLSVPASSKRAYCGIYAADTASMQWRRIGSLPSPMAYGASATLPRGIVMLAPDRRAWLLTSSGLQALPEMPAAIDNAAAAAVGEKVYIAGGNCNGEPSSALYCLDLARGEWQTLRPMPSGARVQPVMAATGGALYVWGGFTPDGTVHTSGLRYDVDSDTWCALPAPVDADGNELTLAGGVAATLPSGEIVACGGVNKDVFSEALRNQAPDYLLHPAGWYKFNPNILVFNPSVGQWRIPAVTADASRAGAALFVPAGDAFYLFGGELKPRVRTASTLRVSL